MSTTVVLAASAVTFTYSAFASKVHYAEAQGTRLSLKEGPGYIFPHVYFPLPAGLRGQQVVEATLYLHAETPFPGTPTLTAQRHAAGRKYSEMTWNNQPVVVSSARTAVKEDAYRYAFPVTLDMQDVANGGVWAGFRIRTTDTTGRYLRGVKAGWGQPRLELTYASETAPPTDITPDGVVSIGQPVFTWNAPDDVDAVRMEVDEAGGDFASPLFDTGTMDSLAGQVDSDAVGWAGLADGDSVDVRFYQRTPDFGWSEPSLPITVTRDDFPTATMTSPSGTVPDPTPPRVWSFTGQTAWRLVSRDQTGKVLHDSDKRPGADADFTPPTGPSANGTVVTDTLDLWNSSTGRVSSPGDLGHVRVVSTWTLDRSAAVTPVASLIAAQEGDRPWVDLVWTREVVPDEWAVFRDDVLVARFPGPDGMEWRDYTAQPNRQCTYEVAPVSAGAMGKGGPTQTITPHVTGLWVVDPDTGEHFVLAGTGVADGLEYGDSSSVWTPPGASRSFKRTQALRGLEGDVTGVLEGDSVRTREEYEADLYAIRARPTSTYRVVVGDVNFPALVTNPSPVLHGESILPRVDKRVKMRIDQTGELPAEL